MLQLAVSGMRSTTATRVGRGRRGCAPSVLSPARWPGASPPWAGRTPPGRRGAHPRQ
ncbi:hypothetical protein QJS66_00900 [Kocuria rhizophila]|nr:hypothetical protein QJS66_00900 [Kocuria rhizophila]